MYQPLYDRISLRYNLSCQIWQDWMLSELGYPAAVIRDVRESSSYREKFIARLDHSIEIWRKHLGAGEAASVTVESPLPLPEHSPDLNTIMYELGQGIPRLQFACLLCHPLTVLNIERKCGLPETGIKEQLIRNWNIKYYSFRCQEFLHPYVCLDKSIEYNDIETFRRIYTQLSDVENIKFKATEQAIRYNRLEILRLMGELEMQHLGYYFKIAFDTGRAVEVLDWMLMSWRVRAYFNSRYEKYFSAVPR